MGNQNTGRRWTIEDCRVLIGVYNGWGTGVGYASLPHLLNNRFVGLNFIFGRSMTQKSWLSRIKKAQRIIEGKSKLIDTIKLKDVGIDVSTATDKQQDLPEPFVGWQPSATTPQAPPECCGGCGDIDKRLRLIQEVIDYFIEDTDDLVFSYLGQLHFMRALAHGHTIEEFAKQLIERTL